MFSFLSLVVPTKQLRVAAVLLGLAPGIARAQTTSFAYTGQPQYYTVPAGITQVAVVAAGAAGGRVSTTQARSLGARVQATIAVVPGEVLTVVVGQQGADGSGNNSYNGGGSGGFGAGGGGGATDLRRPGASTGDYLATRAALLVAGGAGGTDWINSPTPQGGAGGAPMGGTGVGLNGNVPGQGATQRTVGAGGPPGIEARGGQGGFGGGGGGYYGGGAAALNGNSGGGGGGSSWVAPVAQLGAVVYSVDSTATDGRLTITPVVAAAPLPVALVDFTAQAQGGGVSLAWHTASEVGSDRFDVERSTDGTTFGKLGAVAAHGTTTQAHAYAFRDAQLPSGATMLYYRLRQVDLDGSVHFSPVRSVAIAMSAVAFGAEVYPNPWVGELHVQLAGIGAEPISFLLYDALGKLVRSHTTASAQQVVLPAATDLPTGVYYLRISQGAARQVVKLTR
jgi:hypothetical protein